MRRAGSKVCRGGSMITAACSIVGPTIGPSSGAGPVAWRFEALGEQPVLRPTPGWYDADGVVSPVVREHAGRLWMVYAGHNYSPDCPGGPGVRVCGAVSSDGYRWVKHPAPLLEPRRDMPWVSEGVA